MQRPAKPFTPVRFRLQPPKEIKMFEDSVILITGGTGSFGNAFVTKILNDYKPKKLIILSRDEMKQWDMQKKFLIIKF